MVADRRLEKSDLKKGKIVKFFAVLPFFHLKWSHFDENGPFNLF